MTDAEYIVFATEGNEVGHELVEHLAGDHPVARAHDRIGDLMLAP